MFLSGAIGKHNLSDPIYEYIYLDKVGVDISGQNLAQCP